MNETRAKTLLDNLKNDSEKFYNDGKSYELLQEYFKGFSKDTLRTLFHSKDKWARRVAIWITSELAAEGSDLLEDVLAQINDDDEYICSYALEIIANCAHDEHIKAFVNVFFLLDASNQKTKMSVMNIISNLPISRINEAFIYIKSMDNYDISHKQGLLSLINLNSLTHSDITLMIENENPIIRKYGTIIAKKLYKKYPQIINDATHNQDFDVRRFSEQVIETERVFEQL